MKKMLLIDGNSLIHRAFHALPPLRTSKGVHTNAVYGFTNMLLRILKEEEPEYVMVAFDKKGPTFRHNKYSAYKGTRSKTPDELIGQFDIIKDVLDALHIGYLEVQNFEADDILGTVSKKAEDAGIFSLIVTGDKDALQLVSKNTHIMLTKKGISEMEICDEAYVEKLYGILPKSVADLKGLMGDKSDNIPGVPGVGVKTAAKLLQKFGSVEAVLDNLDKLKGKLKENLEQNQEKARISKYLATIVTDMNLDIDFKDFMYRDADFERLTKIFQEMEFYSLITRIEPLSGGTDTLPQIEVKDVATQDDLKVLIAELKDLKNIAIDIENLKDTKNLILFAKDSSYCISFDLLDKDKELKKAIKKILEDDNLYKITYDAKNTRNELRELCIDFYSQFDLELAAYILDPLKSKYELDILTMEYLGKSIDKTQNITQHILYYLPLKDKMAKRIKDFEMENLYYNMELYLSAVLADMERNGIKVNPEKLQDLSDKFGEKLAKLTEDIYKMSGMEFNINSPKQLGDVLFEKLGLPVIKKTKTGFSTNAEVLEKLRPKHPIIEKILEYRSLMKLKSTYADGLLALVNKDTGKIYTSFNQTVTSTGRISSTEPNLQNIPVKTEEGKHIRGVFTAEDRDHVLLSGDYSQIELRVLAHISGDPSLIEAFVDNQDIHTRTASEVFGVKIEEVTPLLRDRAKAVNFGIVYGISDFGLAKRLDISNREAQDYIDAYFERYPGVRDYVRETIKRAREKGYVTTLFNRRRYIPDIDNRNYHLRSFAERTAMNTPIQGTAADIIKIAMVNVYRHLKKNKLKTKLILQVHDELIFNVPKEEISIVKGIVKENMEKAISLKVPLVVDFTQGYTWEEL